MRAIEVEGAPRAIGPYSQGQVIELPGVGRLVFTAGQVGIDPARGELVTGGIAEQTERVFQNLEAVLEGAGCGFADVVKTTVFLTDMQDFQAMNEIYARRFTGPPPARTTIAAVGLPKGARVEIEAVAFKRA
ncbi:MAG TPA: RidA family protein [Candidatus Eisenbacteria bacterium]|nr:RidA family protein [Candidatus Eisenbacteria bacterium]